MPDLYTVTFSSPEFKTVFEYLNYGQSPAFSYRNEPERFLNVLGPDGLTNRQRIERTYYTASEKEYVGKSAEFLLIKTGTLFYLEFEVVNETSFLTEGIEVVSNNEPAFKAAKLAELEADERYKAIYKPIKGEFKTGVLQNMHPEVTVWIWCRSLSPSSDDDGELTGSIFDLTPFIEKCSTNVSKNGGNWSISLPPLVCQLDENNKWVISKENITQYETENETSLEGMGYVAQGAMHTVGEDEIGQAEINRNKFLFHNMIRSNDLIFIRFETLDIERDQRYEDSRRFFIDKSNLANRIYDMIGLVDSNTQSVNPNTNDVSTILVGRDLSKLFIEDGTYFYALENSQGILRLAGQSTAKNILTQRLISDGAINFIGMYEYKSIDHIFKFIIQQLSNIKVVPNNLFSSYEKSIKRVNGRDIEYDARNYRFNEEDGVQNRDTSNTTGYKRQFKKELNAGIWQIVKLVIDDSVTSRRLADSSFSTANGSLLNFLRSAAQEPLVELYMDTYKDMYHIIVRKPPTDQKGLITLIEGKVNTEDPAQTAAPAIVDVEEYDVLQENLSMNDDQVYSWYHFFPKGALTATAQEYSLSYLPALYFPEYAEVFGSKPFQQSNTYLPYIPLQKNNSNVDIVYKQAVQDLKYVVESNQYLPFTRKGTIVLNRDRRIKVGNVIRYKATGEIFLIDSVQQTYQISGETVEATTTIQVSRGMVEQLIYGINLQGQGGKNRYVSYFNIIDTRLNFKEKEYVKRVTRTKESTSPYLVKETPDINIQVGSYILRPTMVTGMFYLDEYNRFPQSKQLFIKFINGINERGYSVILVPDSTNRSYERQAALRAQNKLNARPGTSKHERGSAIDITIIDSKTGKTYSKNTSEAEWRSTGVPALANSLGLQWGGPANNGTFDNYIDRVHFEIKNYSAPALTKPSITEDYVQEVRTKGIDLEGVFTNFKVNRFAFNFFLKNRQFSDEFKSVKSRSVYDNDGETLKEVVIIEKRKKNK